MLNRHAQNNHRCFTPELLSPKNAHVESYTVCWPFGLSRPLGLTLVLPPELKVGFSHTDPAIVSVSVLPDFAVAVAAIVSHLSLSLPICLTLPAFYG